MSGILTLVADEITAVLNAAKDAESFESLTADEVVSLTIRRSYADWDDEFKDLKELAVDVVPVTSGASGGDVVELGSETALETDPAFDVSVRFRFDATHREHDGRLKNSSVDRLVWLVEELYRELASNRAEQLDIAGISANWIETSVRTYCDYKRLREGNFLGVVRVRYNVSKVG